MNLHFQSKNTRGKINLSAGIISDVSVITEGDAIGHGLSIDAASLATLKAAADKFSSGIKCKISHGTGAESIVGVLRNFRISGKQVVADLHLLKSNPFSARLLEMAKEIPDSFGLSISFGYTPEDISGKKFIRVLSLDSVDIVDSPAANPGGLFAALSKKAACNVCGAPDQSAGQACTKCGRRSVGFGVMPRTDFDALPVCARAQFMRNGGKLTD